MDPGLRIDLMVALAILFIASVIYQHWNHRKLFYQLKKRHPGKYREYNPFDYGYWQFSFFDANRIKFGFEAIFSDRLSLDKEMERIIGLNRILFITSSCAILLFILVRYIG